jgi:hypothetical protein
LLRYFRGSVLAVGKRSAENRAGDTLLHRSVHGDHCGIRLNRRSRSEQCAQDCEPHENGHTRDARITCTGLSDAFEEEFHLSGRRGERAVEFVFLVSLPTSSIQLRNLSRKFVSD